MKSTVKAKANMKKKTKTQPKTNAKKKSNKNPIKNPGKKSEKNKKEKGQSKKIINTSLAPKAVGPYSQGVESQGTVFFSGQIGLDPQTQELHSQFLEQLEQILKNIDGLLEACSLKRQDIIKTTIFLTKMENFPSVNAAYEKFFQQPYPARSTVEVSALPKGAQVEIEVIAAKNK